MISDQFTDFDVSQEILDNCDTRNSPFYTLLKNSHSLFFDVEMTSVIRLVKQISDIIKRVEKRFERRETYNVSRSLCEAVTRDIQYTKYPWLYYDFRFDKVRICVVKVRNYYYIHYDGVPYDYIKSFVDHNGLVAVLDDNRFLCPADNYWSSVDDVVPCFSRFCDFIINYGDVDDAMPLW